MGSLKSAVVLICVLAFFLFVSCEEVTENVAQEISTTNEKVEPSSGGGGDRSGGRGGDRSSGGGGGDRSSGGGGDRSGSGGSGGDRSGGEGEQSGGRRKKYPSCPPWGC